MSGNNKDVGGDNNEVMGGDDRDNSGDNKEPGYKPWSEVPTGEGPPSGKGGKPAKKGDVWLGIGLCALLHLLLFLFPLAFFFIGIVQLLYVLPAIAIAHKRKGIVQGLLIGMLLTFLLNAACFGYFVVGDAGFFG